MSTIRAASAATTLTELEPLSFDADGRAIAADAPYSKELQRLVSQAFAEKKVVAAVGYGVSALLNAKILDAKHPQAGMSILYGKQVKDHCLPARPMQPQCFWPEWVHLTAISYSSKNCLLLSA